MQCLNGEARLIDHYRTWKRGCIESLDEDRHPVSWFPHWRRRFLLGWEIETEPNPIPGAYEAIEKLHALGLKVLPLLSEISESVYLVGPGEEITGIPSTGWGTAVLDRQIRSREERLLDIKILMKASKEQKWEVVEKWAPVLRFCTPGINITFFELSDGRRAYAIRQSDPASKTFPPLVLPQGATITERIVTTAYPQRDILEKLGQDLPRREVLDWIAKQLNRIGPSRRHRRALRDILRCAIKLTELIQSQLGSPHYREVGELMRAAFPGFYNPKSDIADATLHLVKRGQRDSAP
jgi:hypothetical protein